jgi:hypothetical protein
MKGFNRIGSTSHILSILQCLLSIPPFLSLFFSIPSILSPSFLEDQGIPLPFTMGMKFLIDEVFGVGNGPVTPYPLVHHIHRLGPFDQTGQQDASDALLCLFDRLV